MSQQSNDPDQHIGVSYIGITLGFEPGKSEFDSSYPLN